MKNQIYGLWDVYSMNYVLYREYIFVYVYTMLCIEDLQNSEMGF